MKAIVVRQPWATLIALGFKTIETRPAPPNGPMRPDGVRGLPGCSIERGERIAIVAGASKAQEGLRLGLAGQVTDQEFLVDSGRLLELCNEETWAMPLGAVVATAAVGDAVQVLESGSSRGRSYLWHGPHEGPMAHQQGGLWLIGPGPVNRGHPTRVADQEPLGDFTPGRWGWLLSDVQCAQPIPCKGRQGVFELPADVAEQIR